MGNRLTGDCTKYKIEGRQEYKRRSSMSVTIRDVAALAGVSPSTVSRTCRDLPSISRQTKEKVRRAMEELGYEPNFQASALAGRKSRTIGVILPFSEGDAYQNSFYLEAMRGISQYCNQKQYISTVITGQDEDEVLRTIRSMSRSGQAEGFIALYSRKQDPVLEYLYESGLPYVLIGKPYRRINETIYVDNDNVLAGKEAACYLIGLGHRRIGCLSADNSLLFAADRQAGYMDALRESGLPVIQDYCIEMSGGPVDGSPVLAELLCRKDRPTAFLVSDDILAMILEKTCMKLGLSIPEDLSVISFNNSLFAQLGSPGLTSVDVNSRQLGVEAAVQMIRHLEDPNQPAAKTIVPHFLVERESCVRVRKGVDDGLL